MTAVRLVGLFWRRGRFREHAASMCTGFGVATAVAMALLILAVPPALTARGDRQAWHASSPAAASGDTGREVGGASMIRRTTTDVIGERTAARVDLAPTGGGTTVAPPGMTRFPGPGEVWVSPAMAALIERTPQDQLGDRYPGPITGTVGAAGLGHRDELLVVVGHRQGELTKAFQQLAELATGSSSTVRLSSFPTTGGSSTIELYRTLAMTAAVLLVVPMLGLIGAAARLTAAHREQRLATLRLAGAGPSTVIGATAIETLAIASVGTVLGALGYRLLVGPLHHLTLAGGPFPVTDLRPTTTVFALVVIGAPILAALSAVSALRKVAIGPLGVRRRTTPKRPSLLRLLTIPFAWMAFLVAAMSMREGGSSIGILFGLGAVIGTLTVIGPWITWLLGTGLRLGAGRPATTIAARRTIADPAGAYRTVSGMVLAGLIAGFLFGVLPTMRAAALPDAADVPLWVAMPGDEAGSAAAALGSLRGVHIERIDGMGAAGFEIRADNQVALERARTAVVHSAPSSVLSGDGELAESRILLDDLGRASTIMSLAAIVLAAAAIAIGTAANLLDQQETLARLRLIGVPITALQRARRWQVLLPLGTASLGSMAMGCTAGLTLLLAFGANDERLRGPDLGPMVLLGLVGVAVGALVVGLTRPLLDRVSRGSLRA